MDSTALAVDCLPKKGFRITAVSKLKHAELYAAAKQMGSVSALAEHLGVVSSSVYRWMNMQDFPRFMLGGKHHNETAWPPDRIAELESKLFKLTGKLLEELFPLELRAAKEFLASNKTIEQTRDVEPLMLSLYSPEAKQHKNLTYEDTAFQEASAASLRERLNSVLRTLTYREREIIKLRYGLGDGLTYTLEEIGHIFRVTREMIRHIEARALRKLQQPSRAEKLVDFIPDHCGPRLPCEPPGDVWPSEIYASETP